MRAPFKTVPLIVAGALSAVVASELTPQRPVAAKLEIPFVDARPVIDALPDDLPPEFTGKSLVDIERLWPAWVTRHNLEIRTRLDRGDEDSVVNFWLYGTSFTALPGAVERTRSTGDDRSALNEILRRRVADLTAALVSPRADERLQFVREVFRRNGIDPKTQAGKERVGRFLMEGRTRVIAQYGSYQSRLEAAVRDDPKANITAYATIFRDRGLSSDTSLLPTFAVAQALETAKRQMVLRAGGVTRVAIIGPGLDFTNKADGYDFYPIQTSQPFVLADVLMRLGLANPTGPELTALDLSPRVVAHLEAAVAAAAERGRPYVLELPLSRAEDWTPVFLRFWSALGEAIGEPVTPIQPPPNAGSLRLRAVRVRPDVVRSVASHDLNIVTERLDLARDQLFDLIVATNTLVYYDVFEQGLALANIARMLRPGGVFLSNNLALPTPPMNPSTFYLPVRYSDIQGDHLLLYRREP